MSIFLCPSDIGNLGIFSFWVTVWRPFSTTFGGMSLGCCISGRPLNLVRSPFIRKSSFRCSVWSSLFDLVNISICFVVKKRPELTRKFEGHVRAAVEYASTIDDFDQLVDP